MPIQFKFFLVPVTTSHETETDLNRFLRSVRALTVHREFVDQGQNSFWCLVVEYLTDSADHTHSKSRKENRDRIDYKEILSPENFAVFARLREWRKQFAASEAVPVYTIFTNEQLASIARKRIKTLAELKSLEGVGEARISRYGESVIKIVAEAEKGGNESE